MKKEIIIGFCILLLPFPFIGQTNGNQESIKAVVLKTFSAMKSVDSVSLKSCFTKNAVLQVSQIHPEGNTVREVPIDKFVQSVMSRKPGDMVERVLSWGPIQIDHEIASAWVPYEFYLKDKFSHKGVDIFLLVKEGEEWKIQTLMYNMQRE